MERYLSEEERSKMAAYDPSLNLPKGWKPAPEEEQDELVARHRIKHAEYYKALGVDIEALKKKYPDASE